MDKLVPKRNNIKGITREDLLKLDKNVLVDKILRLEAHNLQLKNIISKNQPNVATTSSGKQKSFDFSKCHYRRVLLRILYFGWDYQGLAVQEDSSQTIEHHLFNALTRTCLIESRDTSGYHRCGRTDKGVSAFGQVISISLRSKFPPDTQNDVENLHNELPYCKMLNRLLPKDIRAVTWMPIPGDKPEYSARFDCKRRLYKYYFPLSGLDVRAMRCAGAHVPGSRDFRNLCKMDVGNGVTEFIRNVHRVEIEAVDENDTDRPTSMYCLTIEGNAFLWHQIRCIFGVLLLVGQGRESPDIMRQLLDIETNPCKPQYSMASDLPLNLFHCTYELERDSEWVWDRDELRTVIVRLQSAWTQHNVKATMVKDCLRALESDYSQLARKSGTEDGEAGECERDSITEHASCLLQGVTSRVYKPLLKRDVCSSLEKRIEYYKKKRKLVDTAVTMET